MSKVDIISSTMGKALGGANGGFLTGRKEIIDFLRQKARPYLFSNALSQSTCVASIKALDIID
jgi:glycine C-acetyltransferase